MRHQGLIGLAATFGNEKFYDENQDALKQLIEAADNSPDSAQGDDDGRAARLLPDARPADLRVPHVDEWTTSFASPRSTRPTTRPEPGAQNAAEISSWAIKYAAETHLDKRYDEELGGIVGTYIPDVYQTVTGIDVNDIIGQVPPFSLLDVTSRRPHLRALRHRPQQHRDQHHR